MKRSFFFSVALAIAISYSFQFSPKPSPAYSVAETDKESWVDSVFNTLSEDEKIGQLFMIRVHSDLGEDHIQEVKRQIAQYQVGGLCVFQGTPEKQVELLNLYQSLSPKIPLMVSVDAEWGIGMRFKSNTISYPRQLMLGAIQNNRLIYEMGKEVARQLRLTGVHVNFAPVADINNNAANPVIHTRSFGENRYNVTVKSYMYMLGMQDHGVMACAKHFPGHGDTDVDSHHDLPIINHSRERLDSIELYPFQALIQHGIGSIMVAHLDVPAVVERANLPTTLSPNMINQILKKEMGFEGLIFTDALEMKGVTKHFEPGQVEVEALKAGNDILLLPVDIDASWKAINAALADGTLSWKQIDESVKKVLKAKFDLGLTKFTPLPTEDLRAKLNSSEAKTLKRTLIKESLTLVRNEDQIVPFVDFDSLSLASIAIGVSNKNLFQERIDSYADCKHFQVGKNISASIQQNLIDQLAGKDAVIVSVHNMNGSANQMYGLTENTIDFIHRLNQETDVVLVLFGTPYSTRYFDAINHLMVAYEENKDVLDLSAQALFGVFPVSGRLPVTASEKSTFNSGVTTKKTLRLGYALPEEVGVNSDSLSHIATIAQNAIDSSATPGCVVLVAKDGQIIYHEAFGHHTYAKKRPVQKEDIYDLASITKVAATTISLMKLYETRSIDLNAPLNQYLPFLDGSNKSNLILSDVLSHQSGLRSWIPFYKETITGSRRRRRPSSKFYKESPIEPFTVPVANNLFMNRNHIDTMWTQIRDSELPNLGQYYYSDLGFYLSARMIEQISGDPVNEFARKHFYRPLGLYNTLYKPWRLIDLDRIPPTELDRYFRRRKVHGYVHDMGAAMLGGVSGHAGLFSNARELAIIMQMLLQGGQYANRHLLRPETISRFTTRVEGSTRRGLGFDMKEMNTRRENNISRFASFNTYGHYGFTGTGVWVDPEHNLIYIFLSNRTFPSMNNYLIGRLNTRIRIQDQIYKSIAGFEDQYWLKS